MGEAMSTNNYIAKLKLRLDQAIIQRDHWKQLAENRNSILVTEVCPESRSVEEYVIDADSVRSSWRLIREYRAQIEALRKDAERLDFLDGYIVSADDEDTGKIVFSSIKGALRECIDTALQLTCK